MIKKFLLICICIFLFLKTDLTNAKDQIIINSDPDGRLIQAAMYLFM